MRKYLIIIEKTDTGYSSYVPDLPGCIATGNTKRQTEQYIYEAIQFHLEGMKESKIPIPVNQTEAGNVFVP
ncbi:MAG: type II toxin-antitoxin system HicB family antitoxin, partial [Candidatus Moranbacteria bacterium]|nr:type II toxin-antitoxin system HicB family antitoxin [Candidatus Moranbacteria bacterium]